jgi:hypothetical protein
VQGKQRQDEDLVKFGLPGRTTCVPSWRAGAEEIFPVAAPDRVGKGGRPTARRRGRSDRVGERFGASNRWQVPFTRHVPG